MPKRKKRELSYANPKKQCKCGALVPHTCTEIRKDLIGENSKWIKHVPFNPREEKTDGKTKDS
jgi:hypothetical protein